MKFLLKRWFRRRHHILANVISGIGIYWLFVEIGSYSTNGGTDVVFKSVAIFSAVFLLVIAFSLVKNKPKTSFEYFLRGRDNRIRITIGDAFENEGALVVPINDHFDTQLSGSVAKANSIQKQLIEKYYAGKPEHLDADISKKIKQGEKHNIGTTIEITQANKKFFLVVNTTMNSNGRVTSTMEDFVQTLTSLWRFIALDTDRTHIVTLPIINTQHGRNANLSRMTAVKEIIASYIQSAKELDICGILIISIHPSDLEKCIVDLDELDDYLKFSCHFFRKLTFEQKTNDSDEASKIVSIEN